MSSSTAAPTVPSDPSAPSSTRPRHRRRGKGPANRQGQSNPTAQSTNDQPPPEQQGQPRGTVPTDPSAGPPRSRKGQKEGRGSGSRRGRGNGPRPSGQAQNGEPSDQTSQRQSRGMRARGFGARLTKADDAQDGTDPQAPADPDANLRADAPAFVPGVPASAPPPSAASGSTNKGKGKQKPKLPQKPPKVTTKSVADDIATRIHEDIAHNLYECPICTSELGRRSKVWSCELCWTVFHLSCIKKWSTNEGSAAARQPQNAEGAVTPKAWRCPGCNLSHEHFPSTYTCWCEKESDPRPLAGLPPHSCGQTCSRARKGCPHPCDATCHAGPCAPCTSMGPTQDCFCGRNSSTKRCQDTDYQNGWSCGEICGDLLPCGEHTCPLPCHEGLCGACEVKIDAHCYCGKVHTEMLCSSKDEELDSEKIKDDGSNEEWIGCFSCPDTCNRPFDCGVHFCQKDCHPQDSLPEHCPRSPDAVSRCPCGKTPLTEVPGYTPRSSCEDPISNCFEPCGKMLRCGHSCDQICHTGPCGTCTRRVPISCQCGRNTSMSICHQGDMNAPQCFRQCKAGLHCGRHTYIRVSLALPGNRYIESIYPLPACKVHSPSIRALLATDWGFVTESHDPEPHRHVFVLKPLTWTPPVFGLGTETTIGIGGMSVRECVKLRERERNKEREAQRVAALESKAARDAAKAQAGGSSSDGWAQVASRVKRPGEGSNTSTRSTTPLQSSYANSFRNRSMFAALAGHVDTAGSGSKKEKLVLRSGVGVGKSLRTQPPAEVVDSWEEAEEKEEEVERKQEQAEAPLEAQGQQGEEQSQEQPQEQPQEQKEGRQEDLVNDAESQEIITSEVEAKE
ncbi:hypothetical protein N7481_009243 [Penicillium waksmanii]|uniref:uncharacterized protein n=1 Tax=Penicillium waksmanii TaxID=69791 RepID=UPI002548F17B|nr:uncharacterized protein N7481_009243 [Penicillium waksmanii]KAJ5975536.1 hypothetical protein N7481_009243 [Penicillium waksmanii]